MQSIAAFAKESIQFPFDEGNVGQFLKGKVS